MKTGLFMFGLFVLCAMKAGLIWSIWFMVIGALVLIGIMRVVWVWRNRPHDRCR